ncbi:LamG domain-containing protein [Neorhizobium galegae]|uniref:LamG domain-containing protein n=1 Tax=Neorhizobium galegae TaxID=399 RepID=UPI002103BCD6|nr:LamG domain-containing protein [Neorhizobium galegae]MCQ1766118.1 LamG domain-containing protein [Neorhizobium galegae]MCQ1845032.1 LamG domain-containing protein [Neorhizobium galegae]
MADYYITGSVQLTNGSKAVTGIDTAWAIAQVAGGTIFVQAEGNPLPLASIEGDTAATAALEWTGATGTYAYALLRATAFSEQLETNSNILSRLLVAMEAGTLYRYDVAGETADLAIYAERPAGFAFLAIDVNPADLYIKASATSGDWAGPFSYGTGPAGPAPEIDFEPVVTGAPGTNAEMVVTGSGEPGDPYEITFTIPAGEIGVNFRGAYSGATAYAVRDMVLNNGSSWIALQATTGNAPPVLPATANAYWYLAAAKGLDGTGTGDVIGPGGATVGRVAAFSSNTGKAIDDGGKLVADLVTGPGESEDGALVGYDGETGKIIKELTKEEAKDWLATTAVDVSFDNAVAGLPDSPATLQTAIEVLAANAGGKNDAAFALALADLTGSIQGMNGGFADSYRNTAGINLPNGGNDPFTVSLLHFDGPVTGKKCVRDSAYEDFTASPRHNWTPQGSFQVSDAQSRFGGFSGAFDGVNNCRLMGDGSADFVLGTGDFDMDGWAYRTVAGVAHYIFDFRTVATSVCPLVYVNASNVLIYYVSAGNRITGTTVVPLNTWFHWRVARQAGVTKMFLNGVQEGANYVDANSYVVHANGPALGGGFDGTFSWNGYLDEVRISKGIARNFENFTPPTAPYGNGTTSTALALYDATGFQWYPRELKSIVTHIRGARINSSSVAAIYTLRTVISASMLRLSTPYIRIGILGGATGAQKPIANVFIGQKAVAGNAWDMDPATITRVTWGGSDGFQPLAATEHWSDWIAFTPDLSRDLVLSLDCPVTAGVFSQTAQGVGMVNAYQKTTAQEAGVAAPATYAALAAGTFLAFLGIEGKTDLKTYDGMVLESIAVASTSSPAKGRVLIETGVGSDTLIPNTDFVGEISRDNGATWAAAAMSLISDVGGHKLYQGDASLASQPSGMNMKYRFRNLTGKKTIVSAGGAQWGNF